MEVKPHPGSHAGTNGREIWAITAYFNPVRYRRRLANYKVFRQHLGVPLVAFELAYGPAFELRPGDADILIQHRSDSVLWQKERLLNLAVRALPPECTKVAWVDCDVIFADPDWSRRAAEQLDRFPTIQPYSTVYDLKPDAPLAPLEPKHASRVRTSLAAMHVAGEIDWAGRTDLNMDWSTFCSPGHAWAGRRELLAEHGLYDAMIVGAGDNLSARAALGQVEGGVQEYDMNDRQEAHYRRWAQPFFDAVRSRLGVVPGDLYHLWHGRLEDRGYDQRYPGLAPFDFDPFNDIAPDAHGCWRWNSDKPGMHEFVASYFRTRREDGAAVARQPA
jgi:hypothetical protein